MAKVDKTGLCNLVLWHLGVLASGQSASQADKDLLGIATDAAHARLDKPGLVPFNTDDIPEWAQIQLRDIVAADVAQTFGVTGQRLVEYRQASDVAEMSLSKQVAGRKPKSPPERDYV